MSTEGLRGSGIGSFYSLAYRNNEVGAMMMRIHNPAGVPGSISTNHFWSKSELEEEQTVLTQSPQTRFLSGKVEQGMVDDTLKVIESALDKIEAVTPEIVEKMKAAVDIDLQSQYHEKGLFERIKSAIQPEKLSFSGRVDDYKNLGSVAQEIDIEGGSQLAQSFVDNAVGKPELHHPLYAQYNEPGVEGQTIKHHEDKSPFKRIAEAVSGNDFEGSAPEV